jgi:multidrug efflux pump subunit AcrB
VPLVVATGAGAAARQSMGTGVFGGMIIATFVATVFVPLFFVFVERRKKQQPAPEQSTLPSPEQS